MKAEEKAGRERDGGKRGKKSGGDEATAAQLGMCEVGLAL
jgi:hypothetical protein